MEKTDKILSRQQGTLMEKYLTMHPDQFMSYMRSFPAAEETSDSRKDAFRYAKVNSREPSIYTFLI